MNMETVTIMKLAWSHKNLW